MLEATDLSVEFAGRGGRRARAVDGVNLSVGAGEIVALVGESGCGKTTLARTLLGLERPTSGRITYDGTPLSYTGRALKAFRRQVQLVLQDPMGSLNPRQTVYEAVAEGPRIHRLPSRNTAAVAGSEVAAAPVDEEALVASALSRAGLRPPERFFHRFPHQLSGGQRQRVVIAGALALDPKVLIADEPVASLDASVRGEILSLLLRLRDDLGLSALVVTHDLGLAWNIADRVAVMYLGRIVESGPTEDVLTDPQHPYTQALLSVLPESPQRIVLTGEPPDPTRIPTGCRFHPRCQLVAQGNGAPACSTQPLPILPAGASPQVACHMAGVDQTAVSSSGS
ncbi:ABC transporter ATP-binding protein [Kribbella shirazensis]|uniref:Peptide/nickel transport system ATP-binding protein n=1 Tax=Kribbella shirazensis TaxID=1105143 RepID=A0A7X6A502_9ACTN|nr:ABC transporter ATP-binding protein [Kribbella shirazensis]NIK62087.1 peptide/nickel transport system ATP-binding protein [Kribbella shirazensis]